MDVCSSLNLKDSTVQLTICDARRAVLYSFAIKTGTGSEAYRFQLNFCSIENCLTLSICFDIEYMSENESSRGKCRCAWCGDNPVYVRYHDEEWGRPVTDDRRLFEFLLLEGAQAGLSWITILKKRDGYRKAFLDFDFHAVARMTEADEERLYRFDGIVKNRRKIHSAIANARLFCDIVDEYGSFHDYIMSFMPEGKINNNVADEKSIPVSTPLSDAISKDMRRRGFRFFGTVICYSFLQATGFVNDHINSCQFKHPK